MLVHAVYARRAPVIDSTRACKLRTASSGSPPFPIPRPRRPYCTTVLASLQALSLSSFLSNSHSLFTFAFCIVHSRLYNIASDPWGVGRLYCQASSFKVAPKQLAAAEARRQHTRHLPSTCRIRGAFIT